MKYLVTTALFAVTVHGQAALYGQCGGTGWTGPKTCVSGSTCTYSNAWYSQCLPGGSGSNPITTTAVTPATTSKTATEPGSSSSAVGSGGTPSYTDAVTILQTRGRAAINAQLAKSATCTAGKLFVRKEWGDLSAADRRAYIASVQCLMIAPSKLPVGQFPGAHSRYEDFVVVHMQQTLSIHGTGNFLSWHRYFTWSYEQALRTECGYNGTQPYWDWGRWAANPEASPIFDGSDTSMSGNGQKIAHQATSIGPAQNGGGCVQTGPFKNMTVHLGPVSPLADPAPPKNPQVDGYGDNPRCLRRDLGPYLTSNYATTTIIANLITQHSTIGDFQNAMQGASPMGVHGAAHFTIGSDPGGDFYTSPNDPAFWLLHAQIDRVWTIWQSQDLQNRMQVISGGTSMFGGGVAQKLSDVQSFPVIAPGGKGYAISDLVSVVDGPFCYVYE